MIAIDMRMAHPKLRVSTPLFLPPRPLFLFFMVVVARPSLA
jgi:hypothetical protein